MNTASVVISNVLPCAHCGINAAQHLMLTVSNADGSESAVCCYGCKAALESGLSGFSGWSHYDHEIYQRQVARIGDNGEQREIMLVADNIHCAACTLSIEKIIGNINGIEELQVNIATRRIRIVWNNRLIRLSSILKSLAELGYPAEPSRNREDRYTQENRQALKRLLVAGLGMMQVMMYAVGLYIGAFQDMDETMRLFFETVSLLIATPVLFYAGKPFYSTALRDLLHRRIGMDLPVTLAISIAYIASVFAVFTQGGEVYFDSVTMFIFFLSLGRYVEMRARHRAGAASDALTRLTPAVALRINAGREELVAVSELRPGDEVLIKPGDIIPADCRILEGNSRIDESLLTGESTPQARTAGDALIGGSMNDSGILKVRIEKTGGDTVLSHIERLLESAQADKPRIGRLADRVATYFVGSVLLIATIAGLAWWHLNAIYMLPVILSVLVVSCPCALSLATPAALTVGIGKLAQQGLLTTRGNALEALAHADYFVFDKTGTLTYGRPAIREIMLLDKRYNEAECLAIVAALEKNSGHPLARAFVHIQTGLQAEAPRIFSGEGIEATINQSVYRIGTPGFVAQISNADTPNITVSDHDILITLGDVNGIIAMFVLGDGLRPHMAGVFALLRASGVSLEILSGDRQETVNAVAAELGLLPDTQARGRLLPEQKLARLRELQNKGYKVAMIGDGINDAPVLAGADVSIAMATGATLAQTGADIVLMGDTLENLLPAINTAKYTLSIIKQNIFWAIGYNLTALPLAAMGYVPPWIAAIGMSVSSLLVVLNALRISKS